MESFPLRQCCCFLLAINCSLQYGSEIFPTVIRGQGVALCEIVGGVAIFVSPLVVYLVG